MLRLTIQRRSSVVAALAVAAALTLASCAGAEEPAGSATVAPVSATATPSTTPSPAPTPVPSASPTATAAAPAGTTTIATPADGSTVPGPAVAVTGVGTAFEGTLTWRVLRAGTQDVVTEDFTTAGANGEIGPYTFTVQLTPGSYTLEVWEPDMKDGTATGSARRNLATSTFTVS